MNLIEHYQAAIDAGDIVDNPSQRALLEPMQRLTEELSTKGKHWFPWRPRQSLQGLYIYGSVGAGKTYIVDFFYKYLPERKKARFHFHHFMQQIDANLRKLQGQQDPLRQIARHLAQSTRVLCLDEFLVHDVACAMILAELIQALTAQGVILVISSNTAPDDLYLNGVQRARFLPAIALLKKHCQVLNLSDKRDYRLGREEQFEAYLSPLNDSTHQLMLRQYQQLEPESQEEGLIRIQNRDIPFVKCGTKVIWFDFNTLCNLPRSQLDYLELADRFDCIFLSNVPSLTEKHTAQTIMFIYLIDVLYDRGIRLMVSAAASVDKLYEKGEMSASFERTRSRLMEMQSIDYQSRHPKRLTQTL